MNAIDSPDYVKSNTKMSRNPSVREELRSILSACKHVDLQVKDDLILKETEKAIKALSDTVEKFGNIWLCGNGFGFSLAVDVAYKLTTQTSRLERTTRATVLGLNGAIASTDYGKYGPAESLASELAVQARSIDSLWCFAPDPSSKSLLTVVNKAYIDLGIPVVVFTSYPGTPLIRNTAAKIRFNLDDDRDRANYCVENAHRFMAHLVCNQLKRVSRKAQK